MSDGMNWSNAVNRFFEKLYFTSFVILITLLIVIASVKIIKYLIKKANEKDPTGNAKRILVHGIIAAFAGIIVIVIYDLLIFLRIYIPILQIIPKIVITIITCIYNPVAGLLASILGSIYGGIFFAEYNIWFLLKRSISIQIILYCLIIGFIWHKITSVKNKIPVKNIIIFCLLQIIIDIILNIISFIPYLDQFVNYMKNNYYYFVIQAIVIGIIFFIYTHITHDKSENAGKPLTQQSQEPSAINP
jgi:hypothetical protein